MLDSRIAYIYQVSVIFFALSLILNLKPIIITTLYIMIFTTVYVLLASKELRRISRDDLASLIIANPNPAIAGHDVRVRGIITLRRGERIPMEVKIDSGDLNIVDGSNKWIGVLSGGDEVSIEFMVRSDDVGMRFIGPLKVAIFDRLGILVREFEIHPRTPILFLRSSKLIIQPTTPSRSKHPSPGLSRNPFTGLEYEYRISVPATRELHARKIDWRRVARSEDDEVYVKEFDKLRRADIAICIGSGLDLELPDGRLVEAEALQQALRITLSHIREGSRIWLIKYLGLRNFVSALLGHGLFGLRLIEVEEVPASLFMIYLTRLIDSGEIESIRWLMESKQADLRAIVLNLGRELMKYYDREHALRIIEIEDRRLRSEADKIRIKYSITDLDGLQETFRRLLSYRRGI